MNQNKPKEKEKLRIALLRQRKDLEGKIAAIKQDFERGLSKDSAERAVELENAEVLNEIVAVSEKQLAEVNQLLFKLDQNKAMP